tara:strand:- start:1883 stop:2122 length:240 start_codon:yes stop_codon:yes gene_type:complete
MNLDNIYSSTTLVLSHFDISLEELQKLSTFAIMNGEDKLAEKVSAIANNLSSIVTVEEDFEETQLNLPFDANVNIEVTS